MEKENVVVENVTLRKSSEILPKEYLEDKVRLKMSIIGIGNAGNQTIAKAHAAGFKVFAINSSVKDLSDEILKETIPSFIAGDEARGAGKNRAKGKELFKINGKNLFSTQPFVEMVEESDIVVVVAGTGGGTGSAISPDVCQLLTKIYPNKIIIFYGILPKLSDSIMSQNNTIQCLDEINKLKIPFMLADLNHYENIPNDIAYADIGKHIVDSLSVIEGRFLNQSSNGMIDENDMRVIVSEPGYMAAYILNDVTSTQVDQKSIQSYMIDKIKSSPAAMIPRDEIVKQLGVIVNCPEELIEESKTGNYSELTKFIGVPLSIFENYSVNNGMLGQFIILMSGMNLPYSRILQCKSIIEAHEEKLKRAKQVDLSGDVEKFSFLTEGANTDKLMNNSKIKTEESVKNNILEGFFD